jgi:hypothetical protein
VERASPREGQGTGMRLFEDDGFCSSVYLADTDFLLSSGLTAPSPCGGEGTVVCNSTWEGEARKSADLDFAARLELVACDAANRPATRNDVDAMFAVRRKSFPAERTYRDKGMRTRYGCFLSGSIEMCKSRLGRLPVLNPSANDSAFLNAHTELSRRFFMQAGVAGISMGTMLRNADVSAGFATKPNPMPSSQSSDKAGAEQDPYFTLSADFRDVSRGKPIPHTLSEEQRITSGLTRETWKLEVISDPDNPARIKQPLTIQDGTALDFPTLLKLGERHAVRIPKIMTCLNLGCPLGMGLWEGIPLREVIWITKPIENLRRVFYYGFHNNSPDQMFRSSLPIGRILEDPPGMPPVILCYKLNGDWLDAKRGGPVRIVVPEAYGFKSVKWLSHVVLTNLAHANDTYAEQNNDIDSPLKTFAATLSVPEVADAGQPVPVSGYAQVGVSGLSAVQVMIEPAETVQAEDDPYFTRAEWKNADLLSAPQKWTSLAADTTPAGSFGFNDAGQPSWWPMRLTKAHWAIVLPGLPAGEYKLRCRTIDESGHAQPMPRPFRKSGHASIETVSIIVR